MNASVGTRFAWFVMSGNELAISKPMSGKRAQRFLRLASKLGRDDLYIAPIALEPPSWSENEDVIELTTMELANPCKARSSGVG